MKLVVRYARQPLRDHKVTLDYLTGTSVAELAQEYGVVKQRIYQLIERTLHRAGMSKTPPAEINVSELAYRLRSIDYRDENQYDICTPEGFYYHELCSRDPLTKFVDYSGRLV